MIKKEFTIGNYPKWLDTMFLAIPKNVSPNEFLMTTYNIKYEYHSGSRFYLSFVNEEHYMEILMKWM